MTTTVSELRDGLATNLRTITGLRVSAEVPDNPNPPQAVIQLRSVDYNGSFQRGMTTYYFVITVLVGRVAEREAQRRLDAYVSNGASSIKLAAESDKTLNNKAFDVIISEMTNISAVLLGETSYLAADFTATVYAN
jgi:hypothetical protein